MMEKLDCLLDFVDWKVLAPGMVVPIRPARSAVETVRPAAAEPRDRRTELGPDPEAVPTTVQNHYQTPLSYYFAAARQGQCLVPALHPMLVRFAVVPIDLERKVQQLVPTLVHFAPLPALFLSFPMDWPEPAAM